MQSAFGFEGEGARATLADLLKLSRYGEIGVFVIAGAGKRSGLCGEE
jgi:hypothetical protein